MTSNDHIDNNNNINHIVQHSSIEVHEKSEISTSGISKPENDIERKRMAATIAKRNQRERERQKKLNSSAIIPKKLPMSPMIRKRNQRERERQRKLKINLTIENNEQDEKSSPIDVIPNEHQLSTNFMSPSSNISNFNLLHLTNYTPGKINDHNKNLPSESIISYGTSDSNLESIEQSDGHLTGNKVIDKTIIINYYLCYKHIIILIRITIT